MRRTNIPTNSKIKDPFDDDDEKGNSLDLSNKDSKKKEASPEARQALQAALSDLDIEISSKKTKIDSKKSLDKGLMQLLFAIVPVAAAALVVSIMIMFTTTLIADDNLSVRNISNYLKEQTNEFSAQVSNSLINFDEIIFNQLREFKEYRKDRKENISKEVSLNNNLVEYNSVKPENRESVLTLETFKNIYDYPKEVLMVALTVAGFKF